MVELVNRSNKVLAVMYAGWILSWPKISWKGPGTVP